MKRNLLSIYKHKPIIMVLILGAILVNIKSIFTDYNIDSGYAVAIAYRMTQGDKMISQMWEPHQTSAFLCALLIKFYLLILGTTTGLVIYLHTIGVIIKAIVTLIIYNTLKSIIKSDTLFFMCLFFFTVTPKGLPMPEFSNMQIWFSVVLFCCLIKYYKTSRKKWLVLAAIGLCLEILSYPACLIVYIGVIILLNIYSPNKMKDIVLFTIVCLICGIAYIFYFITQMGFTAFLNNIRYIILEDTSHNNSIMDKFISYAEESLQFVGTIGVIAFIAYLITKLFIVPHSRKNKALLTLTPLKHWCVSFFLLLFLCDFFRTITTTVTYNERFPIYLPILVLAFVGIKECHHSEKQIFVTGFILGSLGFLSTLLLTNLSLIGTLNYLTLAVMVSFIPIMTLLKKHCASNNYGIKYGLIILFSLITIFQHGYIVKCMGGEKSTIFNIGGIVKSGPAIGIVSEYMGPYIMNTTMEEWDEYIEAGDRVLIISAEVYDSIMYLYKDIEISIDSTICTPTYSEKLLKYWELNPDKQPNVIIVECWYGDLRVAEDSWIMNWLENNFQAQTIYDGKYWRYYRKE